MCHKVMNPKLIFIRSIGHNLAYFFGVAILMQCSCKLEIQKKMDIHGIVTLFLEQQRLELPDDARHGIDSVIQAVIPSSTIQLSGSHQVKSWLTYLKPIWNSNEAIYLMCYTNELEIAWCTLYSFAPTQSSKEVNHIKELMALTLPRAGKNSFNGRLTHYNLSHQFLYSVDSKGDKFTKSVRMRIQATSESSLENVCHELERTECTYDASGKALSEIKENNLTTRCLPKKYYWWLYY